MVSKQVVSDAKESVSILQQLVLMGLVSNCVSYTLSVLDDGVRLN